MWATGPMLDKAIALMKLYGYIYWLLFKIGQNYKIVNMLKLKVTTHTLAQSFYFGVKKVELKI